LPKPEKLIPKGNKVFEEAAPLTEQLDKMKKDSSIKRKNWKIGPKKLTRIKVKLQKYFERPDTKGKGSKILLKGQ